MNEAILNENLPILVLAIVKVLIAKFTSMRNGFVYIMTNKYHRVLYVGSTIDIKRRTFEHRTKFYENSFTAKYNCSKLVYFKAFDTIYDAAAEENRLKGGSRKQKIDLIISINPEWGDLWIEVQNW